MKKVLKFLLWLIVLSVVAGAAWIGYLAAKIEIKDLGIKDVPAALYIGIEKEDVLMKDYPIVMGQSFEKLNEYAQDPKLSSRIVSSFSSYQVRNDGSEGYDLVMGYEVSEPVTVADDEVASGVRPGMKAAVYQMKGDYKYLVYGWIYAFGSASKLEGYAVDENGLSFETYDVSYHNAEDPKDFVTTIYIPVHLAGLK